MKWTKLWRFAEHMRQVAALTMLFFIWMAATHYISTRVNVPLGGVMLYLGIAVVVTAGLASPRAKAWAEKRDRRKR